MVPVAACTGGYQKNCVCLWMPTGRGSLGERTASGGRETRARVASKMKDRDRGRERFHWLPTVPVARDGARALLLLTLASAACAGTVSVHAGCVVLW
jgi:hypothetical protein